MKQYITKPQICQVNWYSRSLQVSCCYTMVKMLILQKTFLFWVLILCPMPGVLNWLVHHLWLFSGVLQVISCTPSMSSINKKLPQSYMLLYLTNWYIVTSLSYIRVHASDLSGIPKQKAWDFMHGHHLGRKMCEIGLI